jgi:glutaredoxin
VPGGVIRVTIYSRPGCHLCEEMKATVAAVGRSIPLALEEIDISNDPVLTTRYGLEIPVLFVGDRKAAKYRISEAALRRALTDREDVRSGHDDRADQTAKG